MQKEKKIGFSFLKSTSSCFPPEPSTDKQVCLLIVRLYSLVSFFYLHLKMRSTGKKKVFSTEFLFNLWHTMDP